MHLLVLCDLTKTRCKVSKTFALVMHFTAIILLATCLVASANGNAQRITLSEKNAPLEKVFSAIEKQTSFSFVYTDRIIGKAKKVSIHVNDASLEQVLDICFKDQPYTYTISDRFIVVKLKPNASPPLIMDPINIMPPPIDVRGRVVNENGEPVAGASVMVKGTNQGTNTNGDGYFELKNVDENAIIIITSVSIEAIEIKVNGRNDLSTLFGKIKISAEEEVTINTGYYSVKDRERTGSISKITAKDIEKQPVTNVLAALQGRMTGVNIVQESGIAGGGYRINIRGVNSLRENANAPFFIIDGVPYSSDPISDLQTSTSIPGDGNPLASINPSDIESIQILKDADATAIYGSRGANGVVLITTKKGKSGKTDFILNANHSLGSVTRMMEMMNTTQYLKMRRDAYANSGITTYPLNAYDINGTWDENRYTDWQKELLGGTSKTSDLQASASGGSEQTSYLIAGNYRTESSVFPGSFLYKKGGGRISFNHSSKDQRFRINFSGSYMVQDNDLPWIDFVSLSRQLAPNAPALYDEEGKLNWANSTWVNPLSNFESKSLSNTKDLITSLNLTYQLNKNLTFKTNLGFTDLKNEDSRSNPTTRYDPVYNLSSQYSSIYMNFFSRRSWIVEPQLNWGKTVGKSTFDLLAGATYQQQFSDKLTTYSSGFTSNSLLYNLAAASQVLIRNNDELIYKYQAFYGRANYNYNGKYIVNLTGRRDGSSRFGPGKQFSTFGAIGAAWIFNKESFIANIPFLSFGKLRGSYGTTGSDQIGDYQFFDTYTNSGIQYNGSIGLQPTRLFNPDFAWEINKKLEASLDLGFFNDRIFLTLSWYRNRSANQLVGLPLPATTGFSSLQANLNAEVQNSGFETALQLVPVKNKNFSWLTNLNLTVARNKLLSFPGLANSSYRSQFVVGQPITIRKLFHFTGVDPQSGLYQFEDVNGDGVISYTDDRESIRDFNPDFYGGMQHQLTYKRVQLDFLLQFVKQENFNFANTQKFAGHFYNQPAAYINSWQKPGDLSPYQKYAVNTNQVASQRSEFFGLSDGAVGNASFVRLKNISLSYEIPKSVLKYMSCRLSLQAQNLFTITSYKGADPEFTLGNTLPPLRILSLGLQVMF